ncbi:MAG: NADH-quinone oxidoreductase subunit M [Desulfobulbus propionicus]|nr:MAG: NADH-quinone oxidoreductase subunit M [Desulfobulbus propionicus]
MSEHILTIMVFLPILAGLTILITQVGGQIARTAGLVVSTAVFVQGLEVFKRFEGSGNLEMVHHIPWIESLGISYTLGIDGISFLVLFACTLLFPLVFLVLATRSRGFYGSLLITQGAMIGAICSADLVLFYLFWELMLLPIFFIIGLYGGENRIFTTLKITLYTISGSLLMLAAIVYLGVIHHAQFGYWSFNAADLSRLSMNGPLAVLAFTGFMLAFAIKIPLFPLHTWLPDAYTEAPPAATFVLSAIMAKIGVYAVIRFVVPVFEGELARYALLLAAAGVISMLYCGIAAIAQKDFKRMLAFSSASHMGIIALGVFCLNLQGLTGSLYQIVAHATSTGVLFLMAGMLEERCGTREIDSLGGIATRAPLFALFFAIALLASVGLPGTSGFIGEFLIIVGAVKFNLGIGVLAGTGVIVGVCYMLWMFQRVFFQTTTSKSEKVRDLSLVEALSFAPVMLLILFMGVYPQLFLEKIEASAQRHVLAAPAVHLAHTPGSNELPINQQ